MKPLLRILFLEDYVSDVLLLLRELQRGGYEVTYQIVDNAAALKTALAEHEWDIILSDYSMPSFNAPAALKIVRDEGLDIPFIIISGTVGEDVAVTAMKAGAQDFFSKNKLTRLVPAVERELQEAEERRLRREAETQYRQSEARFTKAFHASPIGIVISRLSDGKTLDINERFSELFGYTRAEMIGKSGEELNIWSDDEQRRQLIAQMEQTGSVRNAEVQFNSPSGESGFALLSAEVVELDNEPCILTMVHDITDRKAAEERLKHSTDLISLLRDIAIAANEAADEQTILQYTVKRICEFTHWNIGHVYYLSRDNPNDVYSLPIWHHSDEQKFRRFREFTEGSFAPAQQGLIRKVLETKEPQYWGQIDRRADFVRAEQAAACGLQSAFAFPIMTSQEAVGVFEFFSTQTLDDVAGEFINATTQISTQVGRVIERQRAEAALRESEDRYRALFDHSLNAVYLHDLKGQFIDANAAALDMLGYTQEELTSLTLFSLLPPSAVEQVQVGLAETIQAGYQPQPSEYQLHHKNGHFIDVEVISSVIYHDDKPWAIQGIARNITERKRLHAEEQARRLFAEALHQTNSALLEGILDVNEMLKRILEYAADLIPCDAATLMRVDAGIGRVLHCQGFAEQDISQIMNAALPLESAPNLHQMALSRQPLIIPNTELYPKWRTDVLPEVTDIRGYLGAPIFVGETLFGFINLDSQLPYHFTTEHADRLKILTDQAAVAIHNAQLYQQIQRHAEELEQRVDQRTRQLQEAKDRVEAILNSSSDSIILANAAGNIDQTNPGFAAEFGYPPEALQGRPLTSLVTESDRARFNEALTAVLQNSPPQRIEVMAQRQDQSTFPADALISSFTTGKTVSLVCSLRDITLQKQVEAELRLALEKEKELNQLKTNFTSVVSHEFRTPLAVIMTSASTMLKFFDKIAPERQQEKLKIIKNQVQHLTRLMDDVLVITRSETVGFALRPQLLELSALCERIIQDVQTERSNNVTVDYRYHGERELVMADHFLLTHILQNLISNAIKYSLENGRVTIDLTCTEDEIILIIQDQGIGIPEQHQSKLFESFQRASNVGRIQGTGIGLTIVKRAVDAYRGTIEFESQEEEGTTFTVKLPHGEQLEEE